MPPRQEVLNVLLAQLLHEGGLIAAPEEILTAPEGRRIPDVLVDFRGLRVAIEAEFDSTQDARRKAFRKAGDRVIQAIAHMGIAVVYPASFRRESFEGLKELMASSTLDFQARPTSRSDFRTARPPVATGATP